MSEDQDFIDMITGSVEEDGIVYIDEPMVGIPKETDENWYDFLIDNLYENELVDGNPTVDGLRRLTEKFFGEIIESKSNVVDTDHDGSGLRCTIKHTLCIKKYRTNSLITVEACIDVDYRSLPHPFNKHVVATADTRAEGKALRRALKLRVVTAEEVQIQKTEDEVFSSESINDQQIVAIGAICRKYNINVEKAVKSVYNNVTSIKQLSNLEAASLMDKITSYQRDKSVPEEILGYSESWKSCF